MKRMKNVRDLSVRGSSVSAGYQYEFFCTKCEFTWRSPFKANRVGQITGWLTNLAFLASNLKTPGRLGGVVNDAGSRSGADEAFVAAQEQARRYFTLCKPCNEHVCEECWSDDDQSCKTCLNKGKPRGAEASYGGADAGPSCPNCQAPSSGGRFCHECGFDMASTHKGCPGCGSVMPRAARFCTDCGHGF